MQPLHFVCGHVIGYRTAKIQSPSSLNVNYLANVLGNELSIMACFTSAKRFEEKGGSGANQHVIDDWFTLDVRSSLHCQAKSRNVHTLELALGLLPNIIVASIQQQTSQLLLIRLFKIRMAKLESLQKVCLLHLKERCTCYVVVHHHAPLDVVLLCFSQGREHMIPNQRLCTLGTCQGICSFHFVWQLNVPWRRM